MSKEIKRITATYEQGLERREVEIRDAEDGKAFVVPTRFDPWKDAAVYYHGFETVIENLRDVKVVYADGSVESKGDPKPRYAIPIQLVAESRTEVL